MCIHGMVQPSQQLTEREAFIGMRKFRVQRTRLSAFHCQYVFQPPRRGKNIVFITKDRPSLHADFGFHAYSQAKGRRRWKGELAYEVLLFGEVVAALSFAPPHTVNGARASQMRIVALRAPRRWKKNPSLMDHLQRHLAAARRYHLKVKWV